MGATCDILYCHCAYARVVPPAGKAEVLARLAAADVAFEAVPDLCEMSARRDLRLRELVTRTRDERAADEPTRAAAPVRPLAIAACYPRAVRWLFAAADAALPDE